jgi:hypothetical protein
MARKSNKKTATKGEYYVELDENSELYCVFNTETNGRAYSSWASKEDAQEDADTRNKA